MKTTLILILAIVIFACTTNTKPEESELGQLDNFAEPYRPQFHFSPEFGWMNDPNGMVYYEGEYHLFYQYYPDSTVWGPMHWGHAISTDLVHWEHQPIALYPDSLGYIFSGSAVVDWNNTSGFGSEENPPLIAIFTYHDMEIEKAGELEDETQGIAYSLDKGRSWIKYEGNPVVENPGAADFRDPNVIWHEETQKWIMVLSVQDRVHLYSSENLKEWQFESEFGHDAGSHGGVWECPDLFPLQVEGTDQTKWVLLLNINPGGPNGGSANQYFTGDFDGHTFVADTKETRWVDYGRDNYAGVTWSDVPKEDGRRIFIGWMSNWNYAQVVPTEKWRSAMTIPRKLSLKDENGMASLTSEPVSELHALRMAGSEKNIASQTVSDIHTIDLGELDLSQSELLFEFQAGDSESFGISLGNDQDEMLKIGYSAEEKQLFVDRTNAGKSDFSSNFASISTAPYEAGDQIKFHIYIDVASVEVFVDNGNRVLTEIYFSSTPMNSLKLFANGGAVELTSLTAHELKRIW
ncbi:glycoside hydrolase family 32 protein [Sunxiuqinia dokdonensis]|uniref:Glycosyl hydrolase family 32 n=1 Tax=Sunxiuqinia dokdonensis TaxID=1409788 RepID=A0A0L8VB06_9BACT|nr:glycoside hydrolase family 32 protein [Sunxiuqinia dokdonensis]KOH45382.1 glycosyl hydrolase family 32 [Sunxiuqinia dokdonensis]